VVDDGHLKGMRYPHSTILFQTALVKKKLLYLTADGL